MGKTQDPKDPAWGLSTSDGPTSFPNSLYPGGLSGLGQAPRQLKAFWDSLQCLRWGSCYVLPPMQAQGST